MSQFLVGLGQTPKLEFPLNFIPLSQAQPLVQEAAQYLLGSGWKRGWQLVDSTGDTISELFDIGWKLTAGYDFTATEVFKVLSLLCSSGCTLCIWYGSNWQQLSQFNTTDEFLNHVHQEIAVAPSEVYGRFAPRHTNKVG